VDGKGGAAGMFLHDLTKTCMRMPPSFPSSSFPKTSQHKGGTVATVYVRPGGEGAGVVRGMGVC
jgi:hypothetical protein